MEKRWSEGPCITVDRKEVCTTEFVPVRVAGKTNCTCRHNESIERKNMEFSSPLLPRTSPPPPFLPPPPPPTYTHTHTSPPHYFQFSPFLFRLNVKYLPPTPSSAEAPIHRSCVRKNPAQTRTFRSFLFLQTECQVLEVSPTSLPLPLPPRSLTQFRLFRFFLMSSRITCSWNPSQPGR